jgi:hypothetical protein
MNIERRTRRTLPALAVAALLAIAPAHPRLAAADDGFLLAHPQLAWTIAAQGDQALLQIRADWRAQWIATLLELPAPQPPAVPEPGPAAGDAETMLAGAR